MSDKFCVQEVSAKNRERALKQEYPYRRGRLGYGLLTEKIVSIYNKKTYDDVLDCNDTF